METINIKLISDYMQANRLTQQEFCKQCNISASDLDRIMHYEDFDMIALFKIGKKMNIEVYRFFEER